MPHHTIHRTRVEANLIREKLCELVAKENKHKPISDKELAAALGLTEYNIRYYRETLQIDPAYKRMEKRYE